MKLRLRTALTLCAALLIPGYVARAGMIAPTQLFVFGDSLSDAGNASIATLGAFPGPNYATRMVNGVPFPVGYYTDGAFTTPGTSVSGLWIDQLAALMSLPDPDPALAPLGGTNYAVGSAETGVANPADMGNQIALFLSQHPSAPASALYVFWGGANDVFNGGNAVQAADNIESEIATLAGAGARDFLWLNLPPLGKTPRGIATAQTTTLDTASNAFDSEWTLDVGALDSQGLNVIPVDVNSLYNQIANNPGLFHFLDITHPAQGLAGVNPDQFLFWDAQHPTTAADALIANLALSDIRSIPEPASFALTGLAFLAAAGILKRRRAR